jgi:carbamate kinase
VRILIALGGNALLERRDKPDAAVQRHHVKAAAAALAPMATAHQLIICHGNGPQVGLLALESESDRSLSEPYPLDVLGAQTQGMIGYWLVQELANAGVSGPLVAVVTQTVVDINDDAFGQPTKFIGPVYSRDDAEALSARHGWTVAADGSWWRRVVASPRPIRVVEEKPIRQLIDSGAVVICGGGGGVPVVETAGGGLRGVECVVDKDFTAMRLAQDLHADRLLLLTDVAAVIRNFGTDAATELHQLDLDDVAALKLPAGSMGPKVDACAEFVSATGRTAAIGALTDASAVLAGTAGTTVSGTRLPTPLR